MKMQDRLAVRAETPPTASFGVSGSTSLPEDLLQESCKRVQIASLVVAGLWVFGLVMNDVLYRFMGTSDAAWRPAWEEVGRIAAIVGIGLSVGMALLARRWRDRPRRVLDAGLVFEILAAFLIAIITWWRPPYLHGGRVSWVAVLILVYPSIAPNTQRKTLIAGLAAAAAETLCVGLGALRHALPPDATAFMVTWSLAGTYIAAFLATIPVKIIRRLGRQVTKARELGSYRLEERLGRGGMGEVYRASHRLLARPAAIKLILPEVLGEPGSQKGQVFVERFRREADAAASLRSPHTIELYDFGISDDGTFFYVMEYLDGVDLDTLVERFGPVPPERAVAILQQACASLAEAHARGLVHRDIKPSNIHICRLGLEVDFVKVLDFGLVKKERTEDGDATQVTSPQLVTGTPAYMAPEAVLEHDSVDRRADIYALGCVGYWLLTGKTVFEADTTMKMLLQQVQSVPEPPSRRANQAVPAELDALILACLAKARTERPADGAALAEQLSRIPLATPWNEMRAQAWWAEKLPGGRKAVPVRGDAPPTATLMHAPGKSA